MIGYTNYCPKCGKPSSMTLEEMECDKSLMAWCNHCNEPISLTFSLETFNRWWERYDAGEDELKPPISKKTLLQLSKIEEILREDEECYLDKVEIHFKDFTDYGYKEEENVSGEHNSEVK